MALPFYNWSRTAASNATADATVNWAEGQAPSSVNDSGRAMMASTAAFRDDIAGVIVTGGTSTAYTVSTFQVFDTLAHLNGKLVAFTPHATNGATVTLNVDGLGAKPLRSAPSVELPAGVLVLGSPYIALYNSSDAVFYLHGYYVNPYSIPIAGGIDYWGTTAPNSSFAFPAGQAISRTTYSALFTIMSTTFGTGDGSTTFNLPDKRGRVSAASDTMGGSAASRLTDAVSGFGDALGEAGGSQTHTLTAAQIPSITSSGNNTITVTGPDTGVAHIFGGIGGTEQILSTGGAPSRTIREATFNATGTTAISVTSNNTSGSAHLNVQPTIVCNYIIRII